MQIQMNAQSMGYAMENVSIQWDLIVVCVSQGTISRKASVLVSTKHRDILKKLQHIREMSQPF
jgi:hypothetical protein